MFKNQPLVTGSARGSDTLCSTSYDVVHPSVAIAQKECFCDDDCNLTVVAVVIPDYQPSHRHHQLNTRVSLGLDN